MSRRRLLFDPAEVEGQGRLAQLLDEAGGFAGMYVAFPSSHQRTAVALWALHTHAIDAAETTPYLWISSPEKRSGKTRCFDVLELLVRSSWRQVNPTEAIVFRKIERDKPTLLLDEVDTVFQKEGAEGLRGILNAGHRRGATVDRVSERGRQLESFEVFSAKAFAGIRKLPDTIADRSIPIRLQRKSPTEPVRKFRIRDAQAEAEPIRRRLEEWTRRNLDLLREARPEIPDALNDRAADGWEPLFAIADLAGERWAKLARDAALALHGSEEDESRGVRLLSDIRTIFEDKQTDRLTSADLVARLCDLEESPWGDLGGRKLDARGLARRLKPFSIRPSSVRTGEKSTPRGYLKEWFEDAWTRYLSPLFPDRDSERHVATSQVDGQVQPKHDETLFRANTPSDQESCGLADKNPLLRGTGEPASFEPETA